MHVRYAVMRRFNSPPNKLLLMVYRSPTLSVPPLRDNYIRANISSMGYATKSRVNELLRHSRHLWITLERVKVYTERTIIEMRRDLPPRSTIRYGYIPMPK
jgi:hypothetical protein